MSGRSSAGRITSVKIGPNIVPVTRANLDKSDNETLYGSCSYHPSRAIVVHNKLDRALESQVILHEALHVIGNVYNVRLSENTIRVLENALSALIQDNPKLVRAIAKR